MLFARIAGEELLLHPERALFWPRAETLFVADVHLGKAETFRAKGIAVPNGPDTATLARLDQVLAETAAPRLTILGDLWHAKEGRTEEGVRELAAWRRRHPGLHVSLVLGNHDLKSGALPEDCRIEELPEGCIEAPFCFRHHPGQAERYVLCGHLHPAAELSGKGKQRLRLPCFWFGERVGVLPAFGEFTGLSSVRPGPNDDVYVVAEGRVFPVS